MAASIVVVLGLPEWNFRTNSVPVLLLYGLFWYLQRYVAD